MTNVKAQMPNEKYNLKERTAQFGERVIEFIQQLPRNEINRPLTSQLVRSGTSVGANYMEADGAESKKDFEHKIAICKKESKETQYWLRMITKANQSTQLQCADLAKEADELARIFSSIIISSKNKSNI